MTDTRDAGAIFQECMEWVGRSMKDEMLEMLEKYDWLERMRLKCRAYIQVNGTKTTTAEEIVDTLKQEALQTFPKDVHKECEERLAEIMSSLDFDQA